MTIENEFPSYLRDAERVSGQGQRIYVRLTCLGLLAAMAASVGGAISVDLKISSQSINLGGCISGIAFICSIYFTYYLVTMKPEREWYQGRAAAASVKTLAWQYSVGGGPFGLDVDPNPDQAFVQRLKEADRSIRAGGLSITAGGSQVTSAMRKLRSSPLSDRIDRYLSDRLDNQNTWYSAKSEHNRRHAQRWFGIAIACQAVGLVMAALKAFDVLEIGFLGIAATAAASASAWMQTRDYQNLSQSYAATARDLSFARTEADIVMQNPTEEKWRSFVEDAEQAISREHSLWLTRRGIH